MAVDLEKLEELLRNKLREKFGEQIEEFSQHRNELTMRIAREAIVDVMIVLRDDSAFQFDVLSYMTGVDYSLLGRDVRFDVVYHLYSTKLTHRLRVKAAVPEDDPVVDSVFPVWRVANFQEREAYDFFGIIFQGHPDLRRIMLPDDWEGHPLRKDFPLGGVKSFYFKRSSDPHAGEPKDLVPRIRTQESDI